MNRIRNVKHKGNEITILDFSNIEDPKDAFSVIQAAKEHVAQLPKQSVLTLTDVSGSSFDADVAQALWRLARSNAPHVIAGAVVGIEGLQKDVFQLVTFMARRPLQPFKTMETAMDWLVEQAEKAQED